MEDLTLTYIKLFYGKIVSYVQTIHTCTGIADLHNSSLSGKSVPENLPTDVFHQPGGFLIPIFPILDLSVAGNRHFAYTLPESVCPLRQAFGRWSKPSYRILV